MIAVDKYNRRARNANSLVCVGLDPELGKLPEHFRDMQQPQLEFNKWIIEQTHDHVAAYKLNIAFYESHGWAGLFEFEATVRHLREHYPDIFLICDAKRNEIGNSMKEYAKEIFDRYGFDAATLNPYLGGKAMEDFLEREDKASIILCRTSNPGAGDVQDLLVDGRPVWHVVAEKVRDTWNARGNCMLVAGATYPSELRQLRHLMGDMTFLVPGVGAQGGSVQEVVTSGINSEGLGIIVNSSRGIIFAEDPGMAARTLQDEINHHRIST